MVERIDAQGEAVREVIIATNPSLEGEATALAQDRLDRALARFRGLGAEVEGEVGDKDPILAIDDVLRHAEFDEIILSTLPPGISKWLKLDLPSRVAGHVNIPVTHLVSDAEAA